MSEYKHTPGPWQTKGDEVGYISRHDDQSFGMFCPVAIVTNQGFARLIAAAPELYEALNNIVSSLADHDDEGIIEHSDEIIAARAAIAKALGESK